MKKEDIIFFHSWFDNYVKPFCSIEGDMLMNMLQKRSHTKRVCDMVAELGSLLKLDEQKMFIAETIALFHDVGRFEQLRRYKTYNDTDSENHALLSVKVLEREGVLECLSSEERRLVTAAVRQHNAYTLPEDMSGDALFFSRLIRDADKLDIVWVEIDYFTNRDMEPNSAMEWGFPDTGSCTPGLISDILANRCLRKERLKTQDDIKLMMLGWVFDFNFTASLKIFSDQKYLERLITFLPDNGEISKVRSHIESFVADTLSQKL